MVHVGLITSVPAFIIEQLIFIWQGEKPKIKRSTLQNTNELGGTEIFYKITSLQRCWVRRFDENCQEWKIIPL